MLQYEFEKGLAKLRDFAVIDAPKNKEKPNRKKNRGEMVALDGREYWATDRFWNSLLSRFHLSDTVFSYFKPAEVFERIVDVNGDDQLRFTVEHGTEDGNDRLLAIVAENAVVAEAEDVSQLFHANNGQKIQYHDGVLTSFFDPSTNDSHESIIGKDAFKNNYIVEVPIDGWGKPRTSLGLLRLVCTNGMIAMTPAFRSVINLGKEPVNTLERVLTSFNDADGYNKLHERCAVAQKSWASVRELQSFKQLIRKLPDEYDRLKNTVDERLISTFGDLSHMYGIVNADNLPAKTQAVLPTKATVYDLINMASEIATHHIKDPAQNNKLHAYNGTLIADDYDLQGTVNTATDFQDFFVKAEA